MFCYCPFTLASYQGVSGQTGSAPTRDRVLDPPCPAPSPDLESPAGGRFGLASPRKQAPELLDTEHSFAFSTRLPPWVVLYPGSCGPGPSASSSARGVGVPASVAGPECVVVGEP